MAKVLLKIHGIVQNVGFRYMVKQFVDKHGGTGYVRNLPDQTVELVYQGENHGLEELIIYLKTSPGHSKVSNIETKEYNSGRTFEQFEILV